MGTLVMKFGGSSIGTTTALTQVLSIVLHEREEWDRLVLVASALDGVTDALIEAAHLAQLGNQRGYRRIIANLRTRHLALIEELPLSTTERTAIQADIDRLLFDMLDVYQNMSQMAEANLQQAFDATIGVGEKLSARIIAALLRQNELRSVAIDSTSLLITDEVYGNASPNLALTKAQITENLLPILERGIIPVVTGFIGATKSGKPTTLGRGGSDYTASVLGVCINTNEIWIWTDVDGMMSADPREIPNARVIPALSYEEVAEMAYFGARILHARMIGPLREQRIPLRVKNVFKPQQSGTLIHNLPPERSRPIKAVTSIPGLALMTERSGVISPISALVDKTLFMTAHNQADVMISSQSSTRSLVCFLIPTSAGPDAVHTTRQTLEENLNENPETQAWTIQPVSIVTAISANLDEFPQAMANIVQVLGGIRIIAMAQGPSNCSLSLVVDTHNAEETLERIHQLVISTG
ncbi:MAG: aspartate kinase [Anaerolineae bacterium]|nr:aspartate kinase [Anaerolineae bacterium]